MKVQSPTQAVSTIIEQMSVLSVPALSATMPITTLPRTEAPPIKLNERVASSFVNPTPSA